MPPAPDPIPLLKTQLVRQILALTDAAPFVVAAHALGVDPPRLSDLAHGRTDRFSLERLIRMLASIERRVTIHVEHPGPPATIRWFRIAQERSAERRARSRGAPARGAPAQAAPARGAPAR
jgi:predicted XRE-type DNA-binding protein